MKISPRHKFKEGQIVYVQIRDWEPGDSVKFQIWKELGKIDSLVHDPLGYNVKLGRTVQFKGNHPVPKSSEWQINDLIFVREGDLSLRQKDILLGKLREFVSEIIFREVSAVYTKPAKEIQYINYYSPDGKVIVMTDDRKCVKEQNRLAYKVSHFYGFSSPCQGPSHEKKDTSRTDFHFTMNRFGEVDFWDGIKWGQIEKNKAFLVKTGNLICGISAKTKELGAPSFDQWFVCSRQFKFLCYILMIDGYEEKLRMRRNEIIANLIIPENPDNLYIPHEIPISRFLYAAIFLLVFSEEKELPREWNLPQRKSPNGPDLEPFETWWPRKFST